MKKTTELKTVQSYDVSAAAFSRHPLQMFSIEALPWKQEGATNERMKKSAYVGC